MLTDGRTDDRRWMDGRRMPLFTQVSLILKRNDQIGPIVVQLFTRMGQPSK